MHWVHFGCRQQAPGQLHKIFSYFKEAGEMNKLLVPSFLNESHHRCTTWHKITAVLVLDPSGCDSYIHTQLSGATGSVKGYLC